MTLPPRERASQAESAPHALETWVNAFAALGLVHHGLLGAGGFGAVHAVTRQSDGRSLALKVTSSGAPQALAELAHEAALMRRAGDVAPTVHTQGELVLPDGARHGYLLMDRVAAPTLAERLVKEAPLPLSAFSPLALGLVDALATLHTRGVVHRDLKPENIFIDEAGRVTLIDYGLSRLSGDTHDAGNAGADLGTAEYMSPEQCAGDQSGDVRSDLYSAGVLLYEMLSGAPPFWGQASEVREAHRSRRPSPVSRRASMAALDGVVRTCLAKRPEDRFADAAALRSMLQGVLGARPRASLPSLPMPAEPSPAPKREGAREKRRVGLLFGTSTGALVELVNTLSSAGGHLVQQSGNAFIAAFGHEATEHPVRLAFQATQALRARRLCERMVIDLGEVSIHRRPDGSSRFFGAVLNDKSKPPTADDPPGVMFTRDAALTLGEAQFRPAPQRRDRWLLESLDAEQGATTFGLERPTFVGRVDELTRLRALSARAFAEAVPTLVTVTSEEGFGKSHFAREFALGLGQGEAPPQVIRLGVSEGVAGAQAQLYSQLLKQVARLLEGMSLDETRLSLAARLPAEEVERALPAALCMLGALPPDAPEVRKLAAAPSAFRLAAARVLGLLLRDAARERPLCLVIDDAHLADETSLDALEFATLSGVEATLCICLFVRPSFRGARPAWGSRAGFADTFALDALDPRTSSELVRQLLFPVEHAPAAALARLVERTQGVPRLMVELVRGLKRDGIVRRMERGTAYFLATDELDRLPDLPIVQWNARREVDALPAELQTHAKLCALLGGRFAHAELVGLLDTLERERSPLASPLDAAVGVMRLVQAGLLVRHRDGECAFRHALLRETVYELLSDDERARLHRSALGLYRTLAASEASALPRLALHAARCGERDEAATAYLELGERALATHAYLEAESAFGSAIAQLDGAHDLRTATAIRGRGQMRLRLGRLDDAQRDLSRALELARALEQHTLVLEVLLDEATVLDWLRQFSAAEQRVREVEQAAPELGSLLHARLLAGLTRSAHRRGDSATSVELGTRAASAAERFGDAGYETRIIALLMVGPDCAQLGQLERAERVFATLVSEALAHGDSLHAASAHLNRAVLWYNACDGQRLVSDLERANDLAREAGEASFEYAALNNLAETKYALAELAEAERAAEGGLVLAGRFWGEHSREVTVSVLLQARIALYAEDFARAARELGRVNAHMAAQREQGEPLDLMPGEELLRVMLELALRGPDARAEFDALAERAASPDIAPPEQVEVLEARALWAARLRLDEAENYREHAARVAREKPNLLALRVRQSA